MSRVRFTKNYIVYDASESLESDGCLTTIRSQISRAVQLNVQPHALLLRSEPMGEVTEEKLIGFSDLGASLNLNDFVCVYDLQEPDFQVVSIQTWRTHKSFELKRIM